MEGNLFRSYCISPTDRLEPLCKQTSESIPMSYIFKMTTLAYKSNRCIYSTWKKLSFNL